MSKVLFVHHYNNYSGSTRVLANIIKEEFEDSPDNMILTDMTAKGFLSNLKTPKSNVPIIRIKGRAVPGLSQIIWFFVGFFKALYYGRRYDVFYINTIVPVYAAIIGRLLGKKIVYHVHETLSERKFSNKFAVYIFDHTIADRLFVSKYVSDYYKPLSGSASKVVYNKLSSDFVHNINIKPLEDHLYNSIIMIGSLFREKGVCLYRDIAAKMPDLNFVLVVGADKDGIDSFFKKDIPSNLYVYPTQSNIHPFLRNADLLLNLSIPSLCVETFGMTIIEGMAYGLPAIVPNAGGPLELIQNGYNGFCTDPTNIDEVCRLIRKCLEPEQYREMHEHALLSSKLYKY